MSGPKVWSRFSAKTKDGTVLKFRIQDMAKEQTEDVIKLLMAHFAPEEALHRGSGVPKNPEAMEELLEIYKELWDKKPQNIAVCVSDDGTEAENVIIGASMMVLDKKGEFAEEIKYFTARTNEMKKLLEIVKSLYQKFNPFEKYGIEILYDDRGVVVLPKYRGLGIAQEFFRVRRLVCKEHNIPMTGGWMTSFGSQKAAKRDSWETVYEMNYEDFGKELGIVFENVPQTCIYMIARGE